MIVIGIILIILAVGAGVFAALATGAATESVNLSALGATLQVTPFTLFLSGAVALLLLVLGIAALARGTRKQVQTRRELRTLRKQHGAAGSTGTGGAAGSSGGVGSSGGTGSSGSAAPGGRSASTATTPTTTTPTAPNSLSGGYRSTPNSTESGRGTGATPG